MLFKPSLMGPASGKLGGLVASHNRSGSYFRRLTIPTNPRSAAQSSVRGAMANVITAWAGIATGTPRADWDTWAATVTKRNALGEVVELTGRGAFIMCNVERARESSLALVTTAPVTGGLCNLSPPTPNVAGTNCTIGFTEGDAWNASGGYLFVYGSAPQPDTVNSYSGPFRKIGTITGTDTSPQSFTLTRPSTAPGQKVFFRFVASDAEGRPSAEVRSSCVTT